MASPETEGQGVDGARALDEVCRAARALREDGVTSTRPALAAYRTLAPRGHPRAAAIPVDLSFVAACHALGGDALLAARRVRALEGQRRGPPSVLVDDTDAAALVSRPGDDEAANALALTLGLCLEAAKLAHATGPTPALDVNLLARACGAQPEQVVEAFEGGEAAAVYACRALLHGGAVREVERARRPVDVDDERLRATSASGKPVYVIAGRIDRMHDMLSPYARRLRRELLALLPEGRPHDDDVYTALDVLQSADPRVVEERLEVEVEDGIEPSGELLLVRGDRLDDRTCDPRARESARGLRRMNAQLVLVEPRAATLARVLSVLGPAVRAVVVVSEGSANARPDLAIDACTRHAQPIANALAQPSGHVVTLPSLGLNPTCATGLPAGPIDATLFPLVNAVSLARAHGVLSSTARLAAAVVDATDSRTASSLALEVLAKIALGPRPEARPRR